MIYTLLLPLVPPTQSFGYHMAPPDNRAPPTHRPPPTFPVLTAILNSTRNVKLRFYNLCYNNTPDVKLINSIDPIATVFSCFYDI